MMARITRIIEGLHIYPERMLENMDRTRGLVFSQAVLLALTGSGMSRDDAYAVVQRNAMRAWGGEGSFKDLLAKDRQLLEYLEPGELDRMFDPSTLLTRVDVIYDRVFEEKPE
jgi:adenylosuccinate lyase